MDLCGDESGIYETNANRTRQVMNPDLLSSEALADANACEHTLASNQLYLEEAAVWNETGRTRKRVRERQKKPNKRERQLERERKDPKTRQKRESRSGVAGGKIAWQDAVARPMT